MRKETPQQKWRRRNREHLRQYQRQHYLENKALYSRWHHQYYLRSKERRQQKYAALLFKIYAYYGNKCSCCGELESLFLTLDHVKNDGAAHKRRVGKSWAFYLWVVKHRYPKSLRLLCYNCNCGRYRNGGICPHERTKGGH